MKWHRFSLDGSGSHVKISHCREKLSARLDMVLGVALPLFNFQKIIRKLKMYCHFYIFVFKFFFCLTILKSDLFVMEGRLGSHWRCM